MPCRWGAGGGLAALTSAEPVVALSFVVHLHHAHKVEVPDLPMGTCQWCVTTHAEPVALGRELPLARGTPGPPQTAPEPPTSSVGNALNALGSNSFSLCSFGNKGLRKLASP